MQPMIDHPQKLAPAEPRLQILPWWFIVPDDGVRVRILEFDNRATPLLTAQVQLLKDRATANLGENHPLEILIERGYIATRDELYDEGHYLRLPTAEAHLQQSLNLHAKNDRSAQLYVSAGQMLQTDTERRHIGTARPHTRY